MFRCGGRKYKCSCGITKPRKQQLRAHIAAGSLTGLAQHADDGVVENWVGQPNNWARLLSKNLNRTESWSSFVCIGAIWQGFAFSFSLISIQYFTWVLTQEQCSFESFDSQLELKASYEIYFRNTKQRNLQRNKSGSRRSHRQLTSSVNNSTHLLSKIIRTI